MVSKNKFYTRGKASKRIKDIFVTQIEEIIWKNKLAPETLNLPSAAGIEEIHIFEIWLKEAELDPDALEFIDKSIPFPLFFRLIHDGQIRFAASWKRPSESNSRKWVNEATFATPARSADSKPLPLPVAIDLSILYEQMVRFYIPLPPRPTEGVREQVVRFKTIQEAEQERTRLEARLHREKQFNRKVDTNASLRALCKRLEDLKHP